MQGGAGHKVERNDSNVERIYGKKSFVLRIFDAYCEIDDEDVI